MKSPTFKRTVDFKTNRTRIFCIGMLLFVSFFFVVSRAVELHLSHDKKLTTLADRQYKKKIVVAPKRGSILDSSGDTLAIDIQVDSIYAAPYRIEDHEAFATTLAPLLSLPKEQILSKIANKDKKFVWLKRRLTQEQSQKLKGFDLKGFGVLPEYKRFYPNESLAANLIGAVGLDAQALAGLEMSYDHIIKSLTPPVLVEQDAKGRSYAPYVLTGDEKPKSISLTIDKTIQHIAERELEAAVQANQAKGGVAIVLEAKTGAILAMAIQPSFNPNNYKDYEQNTWRNRAVTDAFEPGSIFKAFTASAALEANVIDLKKTVHCENGAMKVGTNVIHDHHGYGALTLREIIKYSSNICSYKLAQKVGKDRFYQFVLDFGFGQESNINIPGESRGIVPSLKYLAPIQLGTIGFGQGISVTPLQIVTAYAAIANGGFLMQPYIVKEIIDSEGQVLQSFAPKIIRRVISEQTSRQVISLLETVVETGGTGTRAKLDFYQAAGKTGTAQKVLSGAKGYAKDKYFASFVGFAPTRDPYLVTLVSIDEPRGSHYGGIVSAPVFREIMTQSLAYLKVAPDEIMVTKNPLQPTPDKAQTNTQKKSGKGNKEVEKSNEENDVTTNIVKESTDIAKKSTDTVKESTTEDKLTAPDLKGLSVREALRKAESLEIKLSVKGSGICHNQQPEAGTSVASNEVIVLECSPPI